MRDFKIGDIVECNNSNDALLFVAGFIHDSERLFVVDPTEKLNKGREFEVRFREVTGQWREVKEDQP
jgi:hypothetical protein